MKTLKNHKLLIDANCPMCKLYGTSFEKYGILQTGTCLPFQNINSKKFKTLDKRKAQNEIALINNNSGEILYGIKALQKILISSKSPFNKVINHRLIQFILERLYKFISYNRKVIALNNHQYNSDCQPDFVLKYRVLYLVLGAIFTSLVLFQFNKLLTPITGWENTIYRESTICFGQIIWQFTILFFIPFRHRIQYLGNMTTVSILGGFLLLPFIVIGKIFTISSFFFLLAFLFVVSLMFLEHLRRCKLLNLGFVPSLSWICYRLFVLLILIVN